MLAGAVKYPSTELRSGDSVSLHHQNNLRAGEPLDVSTFAVGSQLGINVFRAGNADNPIAFLSTFTGETAKEFANSGSFHNLNLQLSGTVRVDLQTGRSTHSHLIVPGQLSLNVAHDEYRCIAWPSPGILTLHVSIPPQWLEKIREEENLQLRHKREDLRPEMGLWHNHLRLSALRIADALRCSNTENQLALDEYNLTLAVELIHQQSGNGVPPSGARRLPNQKLRRAVNFLIEHLGDDVSLARLAAEVGLSPYHFARSFRASVGVPPHQYVTAMRIERARLMLAGSDRPVTQIGLLLGFDSGNHFSTSFRRVTGVTPTAFRRQFRH